MNDFLINDGVLVKYKGHDNEVIIPEEVTSIGPKAFEGCHFTTVTIPMGVTEIGHSAFNYCRYLTKVTLPQSVTSIDHYAFCYCQSLSAITLPKGLLMLGNSVFEHCESLKRMSIPASILSIGNNLFASCFALEAVSLPDQITTIPNRMFVSCKSLKSIDLPAQLTQIGPYAFTGCELLSDIRLPEGLQTIGNNAFIDCSRLQEIHIPAGVQEIGSSALNCPGLRTVSVDPNQTRYQVIDGMLIDAPSNTLLLYPPCREETSVSVPPSVQAVGPYAFQHNARLQKIQLPESIASIGEGAFSNCGALCEINLPQHLSQFSQMMFFNCKSLKSVILPEGPDALPYWMFGSCDALEEINIPSSVTDIHPAALDQCNALRRIDVPAGVTQIGRSALPGGGNLEDLYIHSPQIAIDQKFLGFYREIKARLHVIDPAVLPNEFKSNALLTFIADDPDPKTERSKCHVKYLKARQKTLCPLAIQNPDLLAFMCRHKVITPKYLQLYTDAANESGDLIMIAAMMDYGQNKVSSKKKGSLAKQKDDLDLAAFDRMFDLMEQEGIEGMTFAISGRIDPNPLFPNRSSIKTFIQEQGAKLADDVRTGVDYLIISAPDETSEKTKKADDLGIEKMTWNAFFEKAGLLINDFLVQDGVCCQYRGSSEDAVIPHGVREISSSYDHPLFPFNSSVGRITLPSTVEVLADKAFSHCELLEEIVLAPDHPHFVLHNGALLDRCMTRLIIFPPLRKTIYYTVPSTVTVICEEAFCKAASLKSIILPEGLREIGLFAFSQCSALKEICLPNGIVHLAMDTFSSCTSLEKVTLPDSLEKINFCVFDRCTALKEIRLPDSLKEICYHAFHHCTALEKISLSDGITEIDKEAFTDCTALTGVTFRGQNQQALKLFINRLPTKKTLSVN